jgi:hypothetical protein
MRDMPVKGEVRVGMKMRADNNRLHSLSASIRYSQM